MVPNMLSAQWSSNKAGKQSTFAKEAESVAPNGADFRLSAREPNPRASFSNRSAQENGIQQGRRSNKVTLTGRLGRDAIVSQTKNGHIVANFSMAVDESYKDLLGQWQKKTAWHRVQVWEELAETVGPALQKGVRVYVEGRCVVRNWIDRQNQTRRTTEIVASDVRFPDAAPRCSPQSTGEFTEQPAI